MLTEYCAEAHCDTRPEVAGFQLVNGPLWPCLQQVRAPLASPCGFNFVSLLKKLLMQVMHEMHDPFCPSPGAPEQDMAVLGSTAPQLGHCVGSSGTDDPQGRRRRHHNPGHLLRDHAVPVQFRRAIH